MNMTIYRAVSLVLAIVFAMTGGLFLASPDTPIAFINSLLPSLGLPQAPLQGWSFYLILAVAYMYLVTVLAFSMFRHPENRTFPLLLAHAKFASSLLSLGLFFLDARYLVYVANFAVDGVIGLVVVLLCLRTRDL